MQPSGGKDEGLDQWSRKGRVRCMGGGGTEDRGNTGYLKKQGIQGVKG